MELSYFARFWNPNFDFLSKNQKLGFFAIKSHQNRVFLLLHRSQFKEPTKWMS